VRDAVLRGVIAVLDGFLLVGYGGLMLAYDLHVGVAILLLGALHAGTVLATRHAVAHATASELAAQGREGQVVVEALAAPELVRAFAAEELLEQRQEERCIARLNAEVAQRSVSERALQLASAAEGVTHAVVLGLGGQLVLSDQMTLGVFSGLLTLQGLFQKPLRSLVDSVALFGRLRAVFARLDDVLAERAPEQGSVVLARPRGELRLQGVSFRHEGQATPLCQGLDLTIAAGEKVALVGRSGQGKSTLLRLLSGLLSPSEGEVLLDGVELRQLAPEWLARHVGVVLQEPLLLDDSLRANLTLSAPDASEQDLCFATRAACIDDCVARLRDGYETQLGVGAMRLSGGERQRLALARALVRRPRVLLLDEATSSLDLTTEARVHHNLGELGCTRVVIAHRLATVRDADRILVIEGGKIVQQGSYEQLAGSPGLFAQLVKSAEERAA
jgi:ABC-type bacteriocin/lantibiotic exporter with double-glycine peptidase domain